MIECGGLACAISFLRQAWVTTLTVMVIYRSCRPSLGPPLAGAYAQLRSTARSTEYRSIHPLRTSSRPQRGYLVGLPSPPGHSLHCHGGGRRGLDRVNISPRLEKADGRSLPRTCVVLWIRRQDIVDSPRSEASVNQALPRPRHALVGSSSSSPASIMTVCSGSRLGPSLLPRTGRPPFSGQTRPGGR